MHDHSADSHPRKNDVEEDQPEPAVEAYQPAPAAEVYQPAPIYIDHNHTHDHHSPSKDHRFDKFNKGLLTHIQNKYGDDREVFYEDEDPYVTVNTDRS